jgi:hypothetical protein
MSAIIELFMHFKYDKQKKIELINSGCIGFVAEAFIFYHYNSIHIRLHEMLMITIILCILSTLFEINNPNQVNCEILNTFIFVNYYILF